MIVSGVRYLPGYLDPADQIKLVEMLGEIATKAPPFTPVMPRTGKPFSVTMTNCGVLGWVSDRTGYRYQENHPDTGISWPSMPPILQDLWQTLAGYDQPPEACLVNFYGAKARMGLHVDGDEADRDAPVLSISLGDTALFRIGGTRRADPTSSFRVQSGDIVILENKSRSAYHGIDRVIPASSTLLARSFPDIRRINLTLRRVSMPTR